MYKFNLDESVVIAAIQRYALSLRLLFHYQINGTSTSKLNLYIAPVGGKEEN
jgi:hypothetical protein